MSWLCRYGTFYFSLWELPLSHTCSNGNRFLHKYCIEAYCLSCFYSLCYGVKGVSTSIPGLNHTYSPIKQLACLERVLSPSCRGKSTSIDDGIVLHSFLSVLLFVRKQTKTNKQDMWWCWSPGDLYIQDSMSIRLIHSHFHTSPSSQANAHSHTKSMKHRTKERNPTPLSGSLHGSLYW